MTGSGWFVRNWKNLIPPALVVVILGGLLITKLFSQPSAEEERLASVRAGEETAARVLAQVQRANTPTTQPPPQKPYYDFLTCDGFTEGATCEPVFAYPLTPEAVALIGFEPNTAGHLNMERGRSVFVQWRNMHGVNECDLSIGIEPRPSPAGQPPVADRKLYPAKAPGRAALLDCAPRAITPDGKLPTVGGT